VPFEVALTIDRTTVVRALRWIKGSPTYPEPEHKNLDALNSIRSAPVSSTLDRLGHVHFRHAHPPNPLADLFNAGIAVLRLGLDTLRKDRSPLDQNIEIFNFVKTVGIPLGSVTWFLDVIFAIR